jgi:hypothetical protein
MVRQVLALLFLGASVAWGANPTPTPPPLPSLLEPEMLKMRNMIVNASTKVRANVVGLGAGGTRPAQICCGMNLEAIHTGTRTLDGLLDQLSACYQTESDNQMRANVEFSRSDVSAVRQALTDFATADDKQRAVMSVDYLSKNYIQLLESLSKLRDCPSPSAAPAKGGTKKKKGKDKPPKGS